MRSAEFGVGKGALDIEAGVSACVPGPEAGEGPGSLQIGEAGRWGKAQRLWPCTHAGIDSPPEAGFLFVARDFSSARQCGGQ